MPLPRLVQSVVIAAGDSVSSAFRIGRSKDVMIVAPGLTSCTAFLAASEGSAGGVSSAGFARVVGAAGNSAANWLCGPGSAAWLVGSLLPPAAWARVELSVVQGGGATFTVIERG